MDPEQWPYQNYKEILYFFDNLEIIEKAKVYSFKIIIWKKITREQNFRWKMSSVCKCSSFSVFDRFLGEHFENLVNYHQHHTFSTGKCTMGMYLGNLNSLINGYFWCFKSATFRSQKLFIWNSEKNKHPCTIYYILCSVQNLKNTLNVNVYINVWNECMEKWLCMPYRPINNNNMLCISSF